MTQEEKQSAETHGGSGVSPLPRDAETRTENVSSENFSADASETERGPFRESGEDAASPKNAGTPKISVIVPVYKVEKYLPECIESILAQTFTDFELILVDDGSPDNCGKICDDYAARDSRIRVFHKQNGGVSSARNLGLDNARGAWLAFVDSDDTVGEKYLEHLWDTPKQALSLIVTGFSVVSESGKHIQSASFAKGWFSVQQAFYKQRIDTRGHPFSKFYNRSIISAKKIRFDERISFSEDTIFMCEYLNAAPMIYFRDECNDYFYRTTQNSLSRTCGSFEKELIAFLRFQCACEKLEIAGYNKTPFPGFSPALFRAVSALYRYPGSCTRTERLKKIRLAKASVTLPLMPRTFHEKMLIDEKYKLFDFISVILYKLKKVTPAFVIPLYWKLNRIIAYGKKTSLCF